MGVPEVTLFVTIMLLSLGAGCIAYLLMAIFTFRWTGAITPGQKKIGVVIGALVSLGLFAAFVLRWYYIGHTFNLG